MLKKHFQYFLLIMLTSTSPLWVYASSKHFDSGIRQVSLFELYTSQGCSSCPPAEKWFNQLTEHPLLWKQLIPVAFHVDYWNYIGWIDPYAKKQYSDRQRKYKEEGHINSIYTPGFILQGKEWSNFWGWFKSKPKLTLEQDAMEVGNLQLTWSDKNITAQFNSVHPNKQSLKLNIALLGFGLVTNIGAGENKGVSIKQDFVVLDYAQHYSDNLRWFVRFPSDEKLLNDLNSDSERLALVAWVSKVDDQIPIQSVGGWL